LIGTSVTRHAHAGVLVLGVLVSVAVVSAPERVYSWLSLASGLLLVAIGVALLRAGWRRWLSDDSEHGHGHSHGHGHGHGHGTATATARPRPRARQPGHARATATGTPRPPAAAGHGPARRELGGGHRSRAAVVGECGHVRRRAATTLTLLDERAPHDSLSGDAGRRSTRLEAGRFRSLLAVGFAGGLVPSPSALVVLLGGIALGRTWFAVLLVLAYGIGMALALVGTGLLLVRARDLTERWLAAGHLGRPGHGT
jgi:ABC-type nickel/cobalt efflux system permease component RcnA